MQREAVRRSARRSAPGRAVALMLATVLLAGVVAVSPSTAGAVPADTFVVGAAKRSITPTTPEINGGVYLGGYDFGPSRRVSSNPANDDLWARAMVVGVGEQRVALVTLDVVGMGNTWMRAIRDGVAAETGISARGVMVHVSHSHGSPDFQGIWGGVPSAYRQRVVQQAVAAVKDAVATQESATLEVATEQVADLHNNRRAPLTNRDDALSVLQFSRSDSGGGPEVIATLVNYAAHPTTTARTDATLSSDFVGPTVEALEAAFPGSTGFFVNGTLGDISPNPPAASGVGDQRSAAQRLGEAIAARAIAVLGDPSAAQSIPAGMATSPTSVTYNPAGTLLSFAITIPPASSPLRDYYNLTAVGSPPRITADLLVVRLGTPLEGTTLVTFPGEPLSSTGTALRAQLGGGAQFLFATTNESLGYLVPEAEWNLSNDDYEEGVSLERLAGRKTTEAIDAALDRFSSLPLADFSDVSSGAFFGQGVDWLAANGLTQGFRSPRTFVPRESMNRAQMALFLWRLMGEPAPDASPCEFTDMVGRSQEQVDATCWLKETGVTTGINEERTLYGPSNPVTRGQMGAFMFRLAGGVEESGSCGFTDAPQAPEFARAACWMKAFGITTGTNPEGTQFTPGAAVTRGQMAAFLFRLAAANEAWDPTRFTPEVGTCEVLDPRRCLLPFPSDVFTTADAETDTGLLLDFPATATPPNNKGRRIDPTDINRNDGFSPGSVLLTDLPGVDLDASGAAPITDIAKSIEADTSPVLLVNADTGELHPHWVEYDSQPASAEDRLLTILPARNFEPGTRYLVALRNLVADGGGAVAAGDAFAALRDDTPTDVPMIEARRADMEALLAEFTAFDPEWDPAEFVLAWDFTVASERNLTERVLHMRDEALGPLEGSTAPRFTATRVRLTDDNPEQTKRNAIEGTITVPNYQSNTTVNPVKGGAPFNWGPDGLPERNPVLRNLTVPYRCVMPTDSVVNDPTKGLTQVSMYGHGLLGSLGEVYAGHVRDFADEHDVMFCAVSWHGFSSGDILNALEALQDLSTFSAIADGGQQGLLHQMFLGRLMVHPQGFVANAAFRAGNSASGAALLDPSTLGYDGNSQGGIMGGALLAVSPDLERGVLGVPGMNYSILLYRSSDWPGYAEFFNPAYPAEVDRLQALGLAQIMWDRIEANGYAHNLDPDNPLPGTPAKSAMLHVAWADHQVAVVTADNLARTAGIPLYDPPALASDRATLWDTPGLGDNPDVEPFWGIQSIPWALDGVTLGRGAYVMWDSGNTPAPVRNVPPDSSEFGEEDAKPDPHERPRRAKGSRQQKYDFMFGGTLTNCPAYNIDGDPGTGTDGKEQLLCLAPFPGQDYPWLLPE